jgi:FtsP/CotA-like multicopper oxidase with cupredoxin domain
VLRRREMLKLGLLAETAYLTTGKFARRLSAFDGGGDLPPSPPAVAFQTTLTLPPPPTLLTAAQLAAQTSTLLSSFTPVPDTSRTPPALDADFFLIIQQKAVQQIYPPPAPATVIWGYAGMTPGPTFTAHTNRPVVVRQVNNLFEPNTFTTHLHGGHTPSASDGGAFADQFVLQGQFKDYVYPNNVPQSETLWYHDHFLDFTGRNVSHGLAGFYLLKNGFEEILIAQGFLPAPAFDVPLIFQDRRFDANFQIVYNPFEHDGFLGDRYLVNGKIQPSFAVQRRKYRFRLLDGSSARFYGLTLSTTEPSSTLEPFTIIAGDQGFLPHPVQANRVIFAPAERYEIIIDFAQYPNTDHLFLLNNLQQTDGASPDGFDRNAGTPLVRFDLTGAPVATAAVPDPLDTNLPFPTGPVVKRRHWTFDNGDGGWVINDKFYDPNRVEASPQLNTTEIWRLENDGGDWSHPIHIHDVGFQILNRNGRPPEPFETGVKDVVILNGDDVVDVKLSFPDNLGKYVMHCHNAEHEDMRMMVRFDVVP